MQPTNTLTRHLDWYDMILLWDERYESISPISKKMPLHITILLVGSIFISLLISRLCSHYMAIRDVYAISIFFSLAVLLAIGSIVWYVYIFHRKKRLDLIFTIKTIDRDLIEKERDRTEYWVAGFITQERLQRIDMWHELSSCYSLLIKSKYLPEHAQSPEVFKQHLNTLVTRTEQIIGNKGRAYDTGTDSIINQAFYYLDMVYKTTGAEFEDLIRRIGALKRS